MSKDSSGIPQGERDWHALRLEGTRGRLLYSPLTIYYYVIKISLSLLVSRYTTRIFMTSEGRSAISVLEAPRCM